MDLRTREGLCQKYFSMDEEDSFICSQITCDCHLTYIGLGGWFKSTTIYEFIHL